LSRLSHKNGLGSDQLGIELRLAVFQQHLNDFLKIGAQFIERRRLGMSSRETGYISDVKSSLRVYHSVEGERRNLWNGIQKVNLVRRLGNPPYRTSSQPLNSVPRSNLNKVVIFLEEVGVIRVKKSIANGRPIKTPIVDYDLIEFRL
jgi:hypothetical protein